MRSMYVNLSGGLGFNIAFCSFATALKQKYPHVFKISACSPYWDLLECCEAIDTVYKAEELKDFIFDAQSEDGELILHRLYDMDGFVKKRLTYSEAWAKLFGVEWDEEVSSSTKSILNVKGTYPHLLQTADNIVQQIGQSGFKDYVIMQFTGGQSPLVQVPRKKDENGNDVEDWSQVPYDYEHEPLKRHYPKEKAEEFVNLFSKEYPETAIIMYQLPNEPLPNNPNVFRFTVPYLSYYELASRSACRGVVCIDSSLQHLVAGVAKTVVIWAHSVNATNDEIIKIPFGYSYNTNIVQPGRKNDILFFTALGPSGAKVDYITPSNLIKIVKERI
ncbi:MAG: hypothetical protein J6Y78_09595 [Paludibacteraceae bacterium]|nr:hypothetical protein [Paludibacteraceae bacterium]